MLKKVIKFILIVLWLGIIFMFSADNSMESTKKSDSVVIKIIEPLLGKRFSNREDKYFEKLVLFVRKGAHFTVYLILGILLVSFVREFRVINYKSLLIAICLAFLYACSDEVHQLFVSGRSGEIRDVVLDTVGAMVGCLIYYGFYKLRRKKYE